MPKMNSHAPEIITHIHEGHSKPNIFEKDVHPKAKEGCYANAEHPSRQEKM